LPQCYHDDTPATHEPRRSILGIAATFCRAQPPGLAERIEENTSGPTSSGNTVEESYFGADGRPTLEWLRGIAAVRLQYGSNGKTVEQRYLGSEGRLREDKNGGVAIVRRQYNTNRNTVEGCYLGSRAGAQDVPATATPLVSGLRWFLALGSGGGRHHSRPCGNDSTWQA
jgi:hypothetical protein